MAVALIGRNKARFVPRNLMLICVVFAITSQWAGFVLGQEESPPEPTKPNLFSTQEILGELSDQGELFAKLDVTSPYQASGSYLTVPDRSQVSSVRSDVDGLPTLYTWMTPGTYHHPLYFEQPNLERYGTGVHPCLQPAWSAAHFFSTIPILPYKMGDQCPTSIQYSLGHYRPGDCTPHYLHRRAFSWKGAGVQAAAVSGLLFAAP